MISLKKKCLKNIIKHFDRFHLAYSTTQNNRLKLMFEFLKRKYSFEIAQQLYDDGCSIRIEYIDFVINRFLTSLDTNWLDNCPWDVVVKKFAEIGSNLDKVYFNDDDNAWEKVLCHLPNLQFVYFEEFNDTCLDSIVKFCSKIQTIASTSSKISIDSLKQLCYHENGVYPCPELKEIIIGSSENVKNEDIAFLIKNLPHLEKLDYDNLHEVLYSIHKDHLNTLDSIKPYNLTDLQLLHNIIDPTSLNFDDILKICVSVCPHLKSLSCPVFKKEHLDLCSQLSELKYLTLSNFQDSTIELNDFLKLKGKMLTSLKIQNFSLSISCLVQNCPHLKSLNMNKISLQYNERSETIPVLNNLKDLTFSEMIEADKAVTSLMSSSPNLELLSIKGYNLFSADIQTAVLKCCERANLKHVNFKGSGVESKFVQNVLLSCSSLLSLNLEYCELGNDTEEMEKLENIAMSLPNKPEILYCEQNSLFSDYDYMYEYDDFLHTDDDDDDDDVNDDYDYEVDDYCSEDDPEFFPFF